MWPLPLLKRLCALAQTNSSPAARPVANPLPCASTSNNAADPNAKQRGYALLELTFAMTISAVLAIYAASTIQQAADDGTASSTGVYLDNLGQAAQRYILSNYVALTNSTDIAGVATDLSPTIAEMIAAGRLPNAFPAIAPTRQAATIRIVKTNCPGASCAITASACLNSGMTLRGKVRDDLATLAVVAMQGRGGRSQLEAPAIVRGPSMNMANPVGAVNAVVCAQSNVDAGLYDSFVRMGDTRDPNLQGGLTLRGDLAVLNSTTGNVCVQILQGGVINVNCTGQINATTGTFTGPMGVARIGNTGTNYTVDTTGRIKADAGFWTAVGSVFGDNTLGARAAGSVFTIQTNAGVDALAVHDAGRTGSRTSLATPMIGLSDPVALGSSCSAAATQVPATQVTAAASTVLRAAVGGGLAMCDAASGTWTALTRTATAGAPCSTPGATAAASSGVALICSNGIWASLIDRMGYMVAAESWRVTDGGTVPKPNCSAGSTGSRLFLAQGNEQQNVQFVNRYFVDNGPTWTISTKNGTGASIGGDLLVMSYCTY